jgi:hypothetical protein
VRPVITRDSATCTRYSLSLSSADVASSSNTIGGFCDDTQRTQHVNTDSRRRVTCAAAAWACLQHHTRDCDALLLAARELHAPLANLQTHRRMVRQKCEGECVSVCVEERQRQIATNYRHT